MHESRSAGGHACVAMLPLILSVRAAHTHCAPPPPYLIMLSRWAEAAGACLQEFPSAGKQAAWKEPKPPKNDWDATIKEAVTRGKEVPEIDWAKPGQDEAWKVGDHALAPVEGMIMQAPCMNACGSCYATL